MSSRRQSQQTIDEHRLLALTRESNEVVNRVIHDHDYWSYQPALFACCYAIIRIGEGAFRLDTQSRRRLRSAALGIWQDARNTLAHDIGAADHTTVHHLITNELPLLLANLERLGR